MFIAVRDFWTAFSNWVVVIWLALPQILARATRGSKIMFLVYVLEPLIIIAVFYSIRAFLRQGQPNYGTSLFLFYASGFMPYYLFIRISGRTRAADIAPNSFMPRSSALDVYIATALLEAMLNIVTTVLLFYVMWLCGISEARPVFILSCAIPTMLLFLFGMGVGMINSAIGSYMSFWPVIYRVATRGLIFLSGVIVIVDLSPLWLRNIMIANPLSHAIDWYRVGVYGRYPDNSLDKVYLIECTLIVLFLGFVLDRAVMRRDKG